MKSKNKYEYIALSCGYAESQKISFTIFESLVLHDSKVKAIQDLALNLYIKYNQEVLDTNEPSMCCITSKKQNFNFCSFCGSNLNRIQFDPECFEQWLYSLQDKSLNDFGQEMRNWDLCSDISELIKKQKSTIWIPDRADRMLTAALVEIKPELNTTNYDCYSDWKSDINDT